MEIQMMQTRSFGAKGQAVAGLAAVLLATFVSVGGAMAQAQSAPSMPASAMAPAPLRPFQIISLDPAFDVLLASDAQLETIVNIPGLNGEGPLWRKGKLWFSDQKGGNLYELSMDGKYRVVAEQAGGPIDPNLKMNQGPNGLVPFPGGVILMARQSIRDIGIVDKNEKISSFIPNFEGKRFNSPNDMIVAKDGSIWFTDPPFSLPGYNQPPGNVSPPSRQIPFNGVFHSKNGKLTPVITDMNLPNGIGFSPDGKVLYVANTRPEMYVRAYDVAKDGALSNMREFIHFAPDPPFGRGAPDGLKVDSRGNVWMTGPGGIIVIDPTGKMIGRIQLPAGSTNIAFGDADYKSIFLTSGANIYRIKTKVKGQIPMYAQP
jgi:gluconolactonase